MKLTHLLLATIFVTLSAFVGSLFAAAVCGDGIVEPPEQCDEGSQYEGNGCINCIITLGWVCTGTAPSVCKQICGNGVITIGEQCDDGNLNNGDGCSSNCTVNSGWTCLHSPSVCFQNSVLVGECFFSLFHLNLRYTIAL